MASIAFMRPILPGQTEAWKIVLAEFQGPRRAAYEASRRWVGITREVVWLQRTPRDDVAIILFEGEDPVRSLEQIGDSDDPFITWFHENTLATHGELVELPELMFDWRG